jgi:ATP/ADP translocase
MIIASLVFFIITGLLLHLLFLTDYGINSAFLSYIYWVWASVLIIVLLTQFWLTVNEVFNPREAKRLIAFCGIGGILGGIVGGLLARFLTNANRANLLLPLALGLLFACIFVVRAIFIVRQKKLLSAKPAKSKEEMSEVPRVGFMDSLNAVRKNKYLVLISGLVVITVIVSTFIDFQFSSAVHDNY